MTKKFLHLFILLALTTSSNYAQSLTEAEVIGIWNVSKINVLTDKIPKEQQGTLTALKKAFMNSKFTFKSDNKFSFDISFEEVKIKNGHWRQDKSTKTFIIQDWKDKDTNKSLLMEISTRKTGDKVFFIISETFFELEMKRN